MNKEQAMQVIKQVVDQAIANGVFKNTENAATAIQALQIIVKELTNSQ